MRPTEEELRFEASVRETLVCLIHQACVKILREHVGSLMPRLESSKEEDRDVRSILLFPDMEVQS